MRSFCVPCLPLLSYRATWARVDVKRDVNTLSCGADKVSKETFRLVRGGADSHSMKLGRLDSNQDYQGQNLACCQLHYGPIPTTTKGTSRPVGPSRRR